MQLTLGAIVSRDRRRGRSIAIEVRVGDRTLDNGNFAADFVGGG